MPAERNAVCIPAEISLHAALARPTGRRYERLVSSSPTCHQLAGTLAAQSRVLNQYVWRCFSQSLFLAIQSLK